MIVTNYEVHIKPREHDYQIQDRFLVQYRGRGREVSGPKNIRLNFIQRLDDVTLALKYYSETDFFNIQSLIIRVVFIVFVVN